MKSDKHINVSFNTLEYWDRVRDLLDASGRYAHVVKLKANYEDSATNFKVAHVVEKYYGGDIHKVSDDIRYRRKKVFHAIAMVNELCRRYNLYEITGKEALADFLVDERRRKGWKKLIKKHENANEIIALQTIEREYRNTRKGS